MTSAAPENPVPLDTLAEATARLLDTTRKLTDNDVIEPSRLPGWTRGHVLAHLARNADSLVNLLLWASTGIEIPQYPSMFIRDHDIEAGAPRPIAEQLLDNEAAAHRWFALANTMSAQAWQATVRTRQGRPIPATEVVWMRLQEVEIHHVDLGVGYRPADWSSDFVTRLLPRAVADLAQTTAEPFEIHAGDIDFTATVGSGSPSPTISGPASSLLAWLLGRATGADLTGELPILPAWK